MEVNAPAWLAVAPMAALAVAVLGWRWRVPATRLVWPAVVVALIAVAAAGPRLPGAERTRHLAVLVDLSPSMLARASIDQLIREAQGAIAALEPHDRVTVVAFGETARLLISDEPAGNDAAVWRDEMARVLTAARPNRPGTDVAAAIRLALDSRPADMPYALLLLTDGRHTGRADDLDAARFAAARAGVAVEARHVGRERLPNVALEGGHAPARVRTGRPYRLHAVVRVENTPSEAPIDVTFWAGGRGGRTLADASIRLYRDGRPVPPLAGSAHKWRLAPGRYTLTVDMPAAAEPGFMPHEVRIADVEPPAANVVTADDSLALGTVVADDTVHLLTGDGTPGTFGQWLQRVRPDLFVRALSPREGTLPMRPADFLGTSTWILSGVSRDDFASEAEFAAFDAAIAEAVRTYGIRLLMVGGPRAFGPGGYVDTNIEGVLPVDCDPNRDVAASVALVIDTSGSMAEGDRAARVAEAGARLVARLREHDSIALIRFDATPHLVDLPGATIDAGGFAPATADVRARIRHELDTLARERFRLHGETDLYAGLRAGIERLRRRDEAAKLLLLLTDGEPTAGAHLTYGPAYRDLLDDASRHGIVLAVLSTDPVDAGVLGALRRDVERRPELGTVQRVDDMAELPRTFVERLTEARGPLLAPLSEDGRGYPVLDAAGRDVPNGPRLLRYARTRVKDEGRHVDVPYWLARDEPMLARWSVGAGRAAALAVPFEETAMLDMAWQEVLAERSDPIRRELLNTLAWLTEAPPPLPFEADIELDDAGEPWLVVRVDPYAVDAPTRRKWAASDGFVLQLGESHGDRRWAIPAVAPTRFAMPLAAELRTGLLVGTVTAPHGGGRLDVVLTPPLHREWSSLAVDREQLERLTSAPTGVHDWLAQQAPARGMGRPLAPWIALLAIAALLGDAATRLGRRPRAVGR